MRFRELVVDRVNLTKTLLIISIFGFSFGANSQEVMNGEDVGNSGLYFSGSYRSSFPNFGNLDVEEINSLVPNVGTEVKMSMKGGVTADVNRADSFVTYKYAFYDSDYFGFTGSMGYYMGDLRFEVEGVYNEFAVRGGANSVHEDDPTYIALVREKQITRSNYVVVQNKKVAISSMIFNVCYDIKSKKEPITSYMCLGVSGNVMNILNTTKVTHGYYGKIGVGIEATDEMLLFIGGYYHSMNKNHFNNIKLIIPDDNGSRPKPTFATAKMDIAYLGGEIGLRYLF